MNRILIVIIGLSVFFNIKGQTQITLEEAIRIATDSSLSAFKAQNLYLAGYWEYSMYKAGRKPQIILNTTLFNYDQSLTKRYNSVSNVDEYREQKSLNSYLSASVSQNLPFSGGSIFINSDLSRIQNYGENSFTQFSTTPVSIGLQQPIFGYNKFKWSKRIEPLKYEKAKKEYISSIESISLQVVDYYFDLLIAKNNLKMAENNVANSDTMYNIGLKRFEIASLSQSDLLTLKVEALNARNKLSEAQKALKSAAFLFYSYLRLNNNNSLELIEPEYVPQCTIDIEKALNDAVNNNPEILGYEQQRLESESSLDNAKKERYFNANLIASFGLNQQDKKLNSAYQNPMDQRQVSLTLAIPIVDWGQKKGKYNLAKKNYEVTLLTIEQAKNSFNQQVIMAIANYSMQDEVVKSSYEASLVAQQAYEITKQRFLIGKVDVNSLALSLQRQDQAKLNYLEALRSYWKYFYTVRKFTLFDYVTNKSLSESFDEKMGVK
ncbi:MAG TPA: TolC family protein [Bacteroidales bacterium]